jgi:hypothetical protein
VKIGEYSECLCFSQRISWKFQRKSGILEVAALMNIGWNQDMPGIIKEIVSINRFKEIAPEAKY